MKCAPEFLSRSKPAKPRKYSDIFTPQGVIHEKYWQGMLSDVTRRSSPGLPLLYEYQLNSIVIDQNPNELKLLIEERIRRLMDDPVTDFPFLTLQQFQEHAVKDAVQNVDRGLCDPIRIFIKADEPVTKTEGRIVFSVSLVDQMIQRMLIFEQLANDTESWTDSFSTIGIQLENNEKMMAFANNIRAFAKITGREKVSNDIKRYDWFYKLFCYYVQFNLTIKQKFGIYSWEYYKLEVGYRWYYHLLARVMICFMQAVIVCTDGVAYVAKEPMMWSGMAWTSMFDTYVRAFLPNLIYLVPTLDTRSNGDDSIEDYMGEDMIDDYAKWGFWVTNSDIANSAEEFYFCSQKISLLEMKSYPEAWEKSVYNLMNRETVPNEIWDQFIFVFNRRPDFEEKKKILLEIIGRGVSQPQNID